LCLLWVIRVGSTRSRCGRHVRFGPFATDLLRPSNPPVSANHDLEPDSNAPAADGQQSRTVIEADTGRSAWSAATAQSAPFRSVLLVERTRWLDVYRRALVAYACVVAGIGLHAGPDSELQSRRMRMIPAEANWIVAASPNDQTEPLALS